MFWSVFTASSRNSRSSGSELIERLEDRRLLSASVTAHAAPALATHPAAEVKAAPPSLYIGNADFLPFANRLIFNRIQKTNPTLGDTVHDTATLLIRNAGGQALVLKSFALTGPWTLVNAPKTPYTLKPGASINLKVRFTAVSAPAHKDNQTNDTHTTNGLTVQQAGGVWNGTLTIATNDPSNAKKVITLAGYWQAQTEHENEPGLSTILNLIGGWTTNVAKPARPNLVEGKKPVLYGEEVASAFWQVADPTKPVSVRMVAAFHNQGNPATISWYKKGTTSKTKIFTSAPDESQSLLPHLKGSTTQYAAGSFTPGAVFGWNVDGEWSDDSRNPFGGGAGHHVRFYPVRDQNGKIEPNNWFIAMDYSNTKYENYDFQDLVYYVENMKPAK